MAYEELFTAIETGDRATVESIVSSDPGALGARNAEDIGPIVYACYWGQREIRDLLVGLAPQLDFWEAATVGATDRVNDLVLDDPALISARSPDGFTALHLAAFFGHPETVKALVVAGADVTARTSNALANQPLHASVAGAVAGRLACSRILLEAGAPVNERQSGGFTPVMAAAQNGDEDLLDLLLARGADPAALDDQARSPADLASAAGHDQMAARLRQLTRSTSAS